MRNNNKVKVLKEGKFFRFVRQGQWEYFKRNNCTDIVIIVAMTADKRVVFVEQFRPPVKKRVVEFPAGLINDLKHISRETLLNGARRELLEETGYRAKRIKKLMTGPVSGGSSSDLVTVVLAADLKKVSEGGGDELEDIIVHEVVLSKVDAWLSQMKRKGKLVEPKIYAGLYFLNKYNNFFKTKK